ncbi:MAG: STAS domain-containing protein, partial [Acidimicrobiales bacterium]
MALGQRSAYERSTDMDLMCYRTELGVVCRVEGDLDCSNVGQFLSSAGDLIDHGQVVFDLSEVPFVDSAGVAALLGAVRNIRRWGGDAVICSPRSSTNRVLSAV